MADPVSTSDNGATAAPASTAPPSAAASLASAASSAAAAASSSAQGAPDTGTGPAQAGTTAPATSGAPASGQPPASAAGTRGPIPYDRHEAALRNAREEVARQFAWAKDVDPQQVQQALALANRLSTDPRSFAQQLVQELGGNKETEEALPEPDLRADDGRTAYSAEQMSKWYAVREKKLRSEIMDSLKPLLDDRKRQEDERKTEGIVAERRTTLKQAYAHAKTLPYFKENEPAIAEKLNSIRPEVLNRVGLVAALYMAYNAVLQESVYPNQQTAWEKDYREKQQKLAHTAAGSVQPNSGQPSMTPAKPTTVSQLSKHMEKLEREGIPASR